MFTYSSAVSSVSLARRMQAALKVRSTLTGLSLVFLESLLGGGAVASMLVLLARSAILAHRVRANRPSTGSTRTLSCPLRTSGSKDELSTSYILPLHKMALRWSHPKGLKLGQVYPCLNRGATPHDLNGQIRRRYYEQRYG